MEESASALDRRQFLGTSASTGLGLALASLRPAGLRAGAQGPGTTHRVAVIGSTGRGGYGHAVDTAWLEFPECRVVGVADDDPPGLARAAERLGVEATFSDYREMLDAVNADIVAICPRWIDRHRDMAVAAAEHGAHVYMEKPFCRTLTEADEVVAACKKNGVKLALAVPTRYSPRWTVVKRLVAEGAIGKTLEYRGRGKEDHRGGGEDLWVLGTHIMDMIRGLGGYPEWCFAHVTQDGEPITRRHVVEGDEGIGPLAGDAVRALFGMADGSTAHFHSYRGTRGDPWRYGLQIYGSRGILEVQEGPLAPVKYLRDPAWSPGRSGATWQDVSSAGIGKPEPAGAHGAARHHAAIRDLLDAIASGGQPICDALAARGATEMIVAVFESHRQGKPVSFPLENRANPLTMLS